MTDHPTCCIFEHPGFAALQTPMFRLTEGDRVPALAIELDGSRAMVPLAAVSKLFGITAESPDGRLLALVAEALRFVVCIRLGDKLPTEVLSGEASWEVSPFHRQIASARLQLQLVHWLGGGQDGDAGLITSEMLVASADDPGVRRQVQDALRRASAELGVEGGPAVAGLIEELALEIAYIEALRERLLARGQATLRRISKVGQGGTQISAARRETLFQVTRMMAVGLSEINGRFEQVDAQTGEILPALRNLEQQRHFLRPNRDWLYCTQLAWAVEMDEWDKIGPNENSERVWKLIDRMYRFTAQRYMAVQEWQSQEPVNTDRTQSVLLW